MTLVVNNVTPVLYADDGILSHQVRLVLLEKQIDFEIINIRSFEHEDKIEDLADLNPYNTLPVFIHRDLVLYQNNVIFEYLEDRYHQYKLLPDLPAERAKYRQLIWRIEGDWLKQAMILLTHRDTLDKKAALLSHQALSQSLVTLSPLFAHQPFFLSDKMGLCDCLLATMLYRLNTMNIDLPSHLTRPLQLYMKRMFERPTFQASIKAF